MSDYSDAMSPERRPSSMSRCARLCARLDAKPIELITGIVTLLGTLSAVAGIWFVYVQVKELHRTLDSTAYNYIANQQFDLDKVLAENGLYPFFEEGKEIDGNEDVKIRNKVMAYAELKLDFLESFIGQRDNISSVEWSAWVDYFMRSFEKSPTLCSAVSSKPREYTSGVVTIAQASCSNLKDLRPPSPRNATAVKQVLDALAVQAH